MDLLTRIVNDRSTAGTVEKVIKNLCLYICSDPEQAPDVDQPFAPVVASLSKDECCPTSTDGILSLLPFNNKVCLTPNSLLPQIRSRDLLFRIMKKNRQRFRAPIALSPTRLRPREEVTVQNKILLKLADLEVNAA